MRFRSLSRGTGVVCASMLLTALTAPTSHAATLAVPAGGDLQTAINAAQGGDVIALEPGASYVGNFVLTAKAGVTMPITIRSAAPDASLPPPGVRMTPAYAALLPKIRSANSVSALRTAAGAHHWTLKFIEFQANANGYGEIIGLGAGDSSQTDLLQVPYDLVLDRLYVHGDPALGQKRGVALHSRDTAILNSYISDCKAVGQDSQAIGGFNGPGNYLIENNYLEGAAENFMLGGADPTIPNLVTSNVTFRRNHLRKPLEWRDPIIEAVANPAAAPVPGGGVLPAGTYSYRVVARRPAGQTNRASSVASAEVSATVGSGGAVVISWSAVEAATEYYVYGRTSGGQNMYWKTTEPFFTDTGTAGTSGTVPTKGTRWSVKNIFELKNAQDVLVEGNVLENVWVADQTGYAVAITPRNQNGRAPWVVVQRVTLHHNMVRHTAGGVNILGIDNVNPSQRTNHITVQNNLFDDMGSAWGSGARFVLMGDGPDSVKIDHNTVLTTTSAIVFVYGGPSTAPTPSTNVAYTNNMSRHNSYGIMGNNVTYGLATISAYLPGSQVERNILAAGSASRYPAGNYFPSTSAWEAEFVDYANGDYRLSEGSQFKSAGTDGADLGADINMVRVHATSALTGDNTALSGTSRVQILTSALRAGTVGQPYAETLSCTGGSGPCAWELGAGSLPQGLVLDSSAGVIAGTPTMVETASITVEAYDPKSPNNMAAKTLSLPIAPPPFKVSFPAPGPAQVGLRFELTPTVSGTLGTPMWTVSAGTLPAGLALDALSGTIAGTPSAWGTSTAVVRGFDSVGGDRHDDATVTITVAPAPLDISGISLPAALYEALYHATLEATGGTGATSWTIVSGALPPGLGLDAGGTIQGAPSATGVFVFTLQAMDTNWPGNNASRVFTLTVNAPDLRISAPTTGQAGIGTFFEWRPRISGSIGIVTWVVASGALPAGLTLDGATGAVTGIPSAAGVFAAVVQATDTSSVTRVASTGLTISVVPVAVGIATTGVPTGIVGAPYRVALAATGGAGPIVWTLAGGALPPGITLDPGGTIAGTPSTRGEFMVVVQATDSGWPGNAASRSLTLKIESSAREIVLYAAAAPLIAGTWSRVADPTAAGGYRVSNRNLGVTKLPAALASPANYVELTFYAEAGVAYHLWIRGKAENNSWANDSVFVQFSGTVDVSGAPLYRIGTTLATVVTIEDQANAGLSGWGWQDNAFASFADPLYFGTTGLQRMLIQVREDGLSIDQIVFSPLKYMSTGPGALRDDTTILPSTPAGDPHEVVLRAASSSTVSGAWSLVSDATAAGGFRIWNQNLGAAKLTEPLAAPANYFELSFQADTDVPYHLWIRGKADNDQYANDSVYVQFSGALDAAGLPLYRIGTTSATTVSIEDGYNAGLSGWGWQDNAFGLLAAPIYFDGSARQTIRVQVREDGLSIDQIVLSAGKYVAAAPGALKNDTTIVEPQ